MGREFLDPISLRRLVCHIKSEFSKYAKSTEIPTKVSELENDSGYITEVPENEFMETDPTVSEWAKQPNKPTYTADEVGALPDTTEIPSKVSQLENDRGYLTEHQDISGKADKATTLDGYGITDAYTKTEIDDQVFDIDTTAQNAYALAGSALDDASIGIYEARAAQATADSALKNASDNSARIDALETDMGDIDTALDSIIAIQNELMGVSE